MWKTEAPRKRHALDLFSGLPGAYDRMGAVLENSKTGAIVAIGTVAAIMLAESVPLGLIVLIGVPVLLWLLFHRRSA